MNDLTTLLTVRAAIELADKEALVLESYLDSEDIWTWGIGVTDKSGHLVARYKDKPSTIERALEIYIWLIRTSYGKDVLAALDGYKLSEAQFAALLCWHYNTGAVGKSDMIDLITSGKRTAARAFWTSHYLNGGTLLARRQAEAALFFDGKWAGTGRVTLLPVAKPSYRPDWKGAKRVDITADMTLALKA